MADNPIKPATPQDVNLVELAQVISFTTDVTTGFTDVIKKVTQTDKDTGLVHSVRTIRETIETPELPAGFWSAAVEAAEAVLKDKSVEV